jgi:hypothetical protein
MKWAKGQRFASFTRLHSSSTFSRATQLTHLCNIASRASPPAHARIPLSPSTPSDTRQFAHMFDLATSTAGVSPSSAYHSPSLADSRARKHLNALDLRNFPPPLRHSAELKEALEHNTSARVENHVCSQSTTRSRDRDQDFGRSAGCVCGIHQEASHAEHAFLRCASLARPPAKPAC